MFEIYILEPVGIYDLEFVTTFGSYAMTIWYLMDNFI